MLRKLTGLMAAAVLLAGCSSPPEPAPVNWEQPAQAVTTTLPQWEPNAVIVPSPVTQGHWSAYLARFTPGGEYTAAQWYAVAHAAQAVVSAPDGAAYFAAKSWLRQGGYRGVVTFRPQTGCLTCNNTEIFFYR
jgi:hypothetical protein